MTKNGTREKLDQLYDLYRTARFNVKYYDLRLRRTERINLFLQCLIVLGAVGSGVAGWHLWSDPSYLKSWLPISAMAAITAGILPVVRLDQKIVKYSKLRSGHAQNFFSAKTIVVDIEYQKVVSEFHEGQIALIEAQHYRLSLDDDFEPSARLKNRLQDEVVSEIPTESLWCPAGSEGQTQFEQNKMY